MPVKVGFTFSHTLLAGPPGPEYERSMSPIVTSVHGTPLLHEIFTTVGVADVPLILVKLNLLNFTFDGACKFLNIALAVLFLRCFLSVVVQLLKK